MLPDLVYSFTFSLPLVHRDRGPLDRRRPRLPRLLVSPEERGDAVVFSSFPFRRRCLPLQLVAQGKRVLERRRRALPEQRRAQVRRVPDERHSPAVAPRGSLFVAVVVGFPEEEAVLGDGRRRRRRDGGRQFGRPPLPERLERSLDLLAAAII